MERIRSQEDITQAVHRLGLQDESVVTGQGTLVALGIEEQGMFGYLELEVGQTVYRALRETIAWDDTVEDLRQGSVAVRLGSSDVVARAGFTLDGVNYEGLPSIYGLAQGVRDTDTEDLVCNYLLSADAQLPSEVIASELDVLNGLVHDRLHGRPELTVAAQGLYAVRTLFGSLAEPNGLRTYRGDYEAVPVAGMHHNYEHTRYDVVGGVVRHAQESGSLSDDELLQSIAAATEHDLVMGYGRHANNPGGYDELRSARLVRGQLLRRGVSEHAAQGAYEGVVATPFNETTKGQNIRPEVGFLAVQTALAGADLSRFSETYGVHSGFLWQLENLQRRDTYSPMRGVCDMLLRDVGIVSPEILLEVIDEDDGLRQAFGGIVAENGDFYENVTIPTGWSLDKPAVRMRNARAARAIGARIVAGSSALQEYQAMVHKDPAPWSR